MTVCAEQLQTPTAGKKSGSGKKFDGFAVLRRSAGTATVFTVLGHTVLMFEQSVAQVCVALLTGYVMTLILEAIDAKLHNKPIPYLQGGLKGFINTFLATQMTAVTMSFLLYVNDRLWALSFAVATAIASKFLFRVNCDGRLRHFFNPSNFGIVVALFALPWVNTIPYTFTEGTRGILDWIVPLIIVGLGTSLNYKTGRYPLILSWLAGYVVQALVRAWIFDFPIIPGISAMTGTTFVLFTLYMITDPATSPNTRNSQILFGLLLAATYGILLSLAVPFALFFSVTIVTGARGTLMFLEQVFARGARTEVAAARVASAAGS